MMRKYKISNALVLVACVRCPKRDDLCFISHTLCLSVCLKSPVYLHYNLQNHPHASS